jgi:hypothetical protein
LAGGGAQTKIETQIPKEDGFIELLNDFTPHELPRVVRAVKTQRFIANPHHQILRPNI